MTTDIDRIKTRTSGPRYPPPNLSKEPHYRLSIKTLFARKIEFCLSRLDSHPRLFGSSHPRSPVINKLGIHHLREKERKTPGPLMSRTLKEKSNLIKRRFVSKTFQKKNTFPLRLLSGPFSEIQCGTVQLEVSGGCFLGTALRSVSSCQQNKTKEVDSRSPPKENKNHIWSRK